LNLNHKLAVNGKDKALWGYISSGYNCNDATYLSEAWRRPTASFKAMLEKPGSQNIRPCGLVVFAMYTDTFEVYRYGGTLVGMDCTNVAFSTDKDLYSPSRGVVPVTGQSYDFTVDGTPSWLTVEWLERFKVWFRTPASPHVRNLYGVIPGGLKAGQYSLNFTVNDPVFEARWGVKRKRIVFSEANTLGSQGASKLMGILCVIFTVTEVSFLILFVAAPVLGAAPDVVEATKTAPPPLLSDPS
jgi:hypothetical protein